MISVGVGEYPEPPQGIIKRIITDSMPVWLAIKTLSCNTNTNEIIRNILFSHIKCIRINKSFPDKKYEIDFLESDLGKLRKIFQLGRESYADFENEIIKLLER